MSPADHIVVDGTQLLSARGDSASCCSIVERGLEFSTLPARRAQLTFSGIQSADLFLAYIHSLMPPAWPGGLGEPTITIQCATPLGALVFHGISLGRMDVSLETFAYPAQSAHRAAPDMLCWLPGQGAALMGRPVRTPVSVFRLPTIGDRWTVGVLVWTLRLLDQGWGGLPTLGPGQFPPRPGLRAQLSRWSGIPL